MFVKIEIFLKKFKRMFERGEKKIVISLQPKTPSKRLKLIGVRGGNEKIFFKIKSIDYGDFCIGRHRNGCGNSPS
ncbi:protein of unknown function [Oenococcus oeni]|nr:hypothetical protein OENI_190012 [Oenococcus oeni]SYW03243.1 hypothetical protein OENI_60138 [Oenococcus oeni]SYW14542.1 hypothetical protein OENI_530047 [Oenococcus oeni]SYW18793.1 hypothetical protein OENI_50140 [Oenococcus oeni]VDC14463.1 protein of unknown function [Oenococcus oeni]